jgi:CRP-like cAMP-binding protein
VETETKGTERGERPDGAAIENILSALPLTTYRAGDTVLTDGAKTGRLLILKEGAVVIRKDSIEIARVEQPGAVLGELSALLDQPHSADVLAAVDAQFYVADAALLGRDPIVLFYVARILAHRLVAADIGLVELKREVQLQTGQSAGALKRMIEKVEQALKASSASFSPGL